MVYIKKQIVIDIYVEDENRGNSIDIIFDDIMGPSNQEEIMELIYEIEEIARRPSC